MAKLLEVKDLRVSYHTYAGEVQAVRGITFDVNREEVVAVVGESGCGKSVTAKSVLGLIKQPPGEILAGSQIVFEGRNLLKFSEKDWRTFRGGECAIIFQDPLAALNPTMRVGAQIAESLRAHKGASRAKALKLAIELLDAVGIDEPERRARQYPHELSGGMRQRVMIAIAFACKPKLLIADEPTTALDVTIQSKILKLLNDLRHETKASVILITHDLGIVANLAQKIIVMYAGRIVEKGSCHNIFYRPKHPYTVALLESIPRLDAASKARLPSIEGTPPDLIAPPVGCAFAARCQHYMEICCTSEPPAVTFEVDHIGACWLYSPEYTSYIEGVNPSDWVLTGGHYDVGMLGFGPQGDRATTLATENRDIHVN
jgi:oligopeptide transport system ATP-binding protein